MHRNNSYTFDTRIRFSEVDHTRRLTIPGMINYFQDCSTFQSEKIGFGFEYLNERNQAWVLLSWQIVIERYPEFNEKITPTIMEVTNDTTPQIQKVEGSNAFIIKTKELDTATRENLNNALEEKFGVDKSFITAETISPSISSEMKTDAIIAVVIATVLMLIYIWIRFSDINFATSAVLALLHDVLVVLAFYAISKTAVGNTFIACMLTIVGYSINATIVIFDRIRENMRTKKTKDTLEDIVNMSVTQTLTRSIYTSFTTFVMVVVLYLLGVSAIREFALPLLVGIICGAYSSVCITGSLWLVFSN